VKFSFRDPVGKEVPKNPDLQKHSGFSAMLARLGFEINSQAESPEQKSMSGL
jgi:hypothetical protein